MASTKMMKKIFAACKFCRLSIITGGSSEGRRRTAAFPRHCEFGTGLGPTLLDETLRR